MLPREIYEQYQMLLAPHSCCDDYGKCLIDNVESLLVCVKDSKWGNSSTLKSLNKRAIREEETRRLQLFRAMHDLYATLYFNSKKINSYCFEHSIDRTLPLLSPYQSVDENYIYQLIHAYRDALLCIKNDKRFLNKFAEFNEESGAIKLKLAPKIEKWCALVDAFDPEKNLYRQFWFVWQEIMGMNLIQMRRLSYYLKEHNKPAKEIIVFRKLHYYARFILVTLGYFPVTNAIYIPYKF